MCFVIRKREPGTISTAMRVWEAMEGLAEPTSAMWTLKISLAASATFLVGIFLVVTHLVEVDRSRVEEEVAASRAVT